MIEKLNGIDLTTEGQLRALYKINEIIDYLNTEQPSQECPEREDLLRFFKQKGYPSRNNDDGWYEWITDEVLKFIGKTPKSQEKATGRIIDYLQGHGKTPMLGDMVEILIEPFDKKDRNTSPMMGHI